MLTLPVVKPEDRYQRFVRWSDEDQCHIGYCPDLYYGDGKDATYTALCAIVRDEVAHRLAKGETAPTLASVSNRRSSNTQWLGQRNLKCSPKP